MSDLEEDMPMLEEEEEEEDELVDDEYQDEGEEEQDEDGDGMDLEDMLAEELDGEGEDGEDDHADDDGDGEEDGEEDGENGEEDEYEDDALLSPTTGGQTEAGSLVYTEDGEGGEGGNVGATEDRGGGVSNVVGTQRVDGTDAGLQLPTSTVDPQGGRDGAGNDRKERGDQDEEGDEDDEDDEGDGQDGINANDDDDIHIADDDEEQNIDDGGEDADVVGVEPVPDVHQQFELLLADPKVPRLPNNPSIIDVSRLTIDQRKVYNAKVMSLLTEEQLDRYECFRRSSLKEPMRRLVQVIVGGGMPKATDKIIVAMAGVGKVFVGELVEEARRIAEERGERGALRKDTMMEAYFRVRGGGGVGMDGLSDAPAGAEHVAGGNSRKRRRMMRL